MDKLYKKVCSYENLELAWFRIKTSQITYYKNYYRNLILAYELSVKENIQRLSERISGGSFKPKGVLRFYLPKASGLHRPVTFLHVDDLIVYQALANIIAVKFFKKRKEVEDVTVFSHILNDDNNTQIYFFKKWQDGYKKFVKTVKKHYEDGNDWVAHFDLAAYYDTVDHNVLAEQVNKRTYKNFGDLLLTCLQEWSTHKSNKLHHGLPQGPGTSGLLAEVYLLPIDIKLKKAGIKYVRYVDDIKIYGKSREEILSGVILLEKECKERGLIPQSKKFDVVHATSFEAAIGKYPSLQHSEKKVIFSDPEETYEILEKAFNKDSFNISKIRYILKVSGKNRRILKFVLSNIPHYPDLADEFCKFLENYIDNEKIGRMITNIALKRPSPFDYVEGKYWELISFYKVNAYEKKKLLRLAIDRLKGSSYKYSLKIGLYKFLCSSNNALVLEWLKKENSALIQAFITPHIQINRIKEEKYLNLIKAFSRRSDYEPTLASIKEIIYNFRVHALKEISGYSIKDDSGVINNTLGKPEKIDSIGQILKNKYEIQYTDKWIKLLQTEYDHANKMIFLADTAFKIERNAWVNYTDSFNEILLRKFISLLEVKRSGEKWPQITNRHGENIDFGVLMDKNNLLSKKFPGILDGFRLFHERRNKTPSSHPYEKKTKKQTSIINNKEQKGLQKTLMKSYQELVKEIANFV